MKICVRVCVCVCWLRWANWILGVINQGWRISDSVSDISSFWSLPQGFWLNIDLWEVGSPEKNKISCLGKLKFWVFGRDFVVEDMGSLLLALGCRSAVAAATVTRSTPHGYVSSSSSSSRKHMHCVSTFVSKRSIVKLGLEVSHSKNPLTFKSIFFFIIILTILFSS